MKKIGLVLSFVLVLSISFQANAQWFWQNPKPIGNGLNKIHFTSDNNGFIYGYWGEILKTTNGGEDWMLSTNQLGLVPVDLKFVNDQSGYLLTNDKLFKTTTGGENWFELNAEEFSGFISIYLRDSLDLWIVGDSGLVLNTKDEGNSWDNYTFTSSVSNTSIYFISDSIGFIAREYGIAKRTTDGGISWNNYSGNLTGGLTCFHFVDSANGFAAGRLGKILKTSDYGSTWVNISQWNWLRSKEFFPLNKDTIYLFSSTGHLVRTYNQGLEWALDTISTNSVTSDFYTDAFFSANGNFYCIAGSGGIIYKSSDFGSMWYSQTQGTSQPLYFSDFVSQTVGWSASSNNIFRSDDGGENWIKLTLQDSIYIEGIDFINESVGYIVGNKILKTIDGGANWTSVFANDTSIFSAVVFIDELNGWAGGRYSQIIKTTDGGQTWVEQQSSNSGIVFSIHAVNESTLLACGAAGLLLKTTNGGNEWVSIKFNSSLIEGIFFIDELTGWITCIDSIYKTTDGGNSWLGVYQAEYWMSDIEFTSENNGYAIGSTGYLIQTSNGGIDWYRVNDITQNDLYSLKFINDTEGWIVGAWGTVLHTTNGGVTFIEEENNFAQPKEFLLQQNYPNPFNPSTKISWQSPVSGWQTLKVYDILGNEIATLVNEYRNAGTYEIDFNYTKTLLATSLPSGVYFYQLKSGDYIETKKMILLK